MASCRFVSALLVLVCGVCVCVCGSEATLQRDYGVKLCGREFIRAVIFTCGGSRWRRSLDTEQEQINSPLLLTPSDTAAQSVWSQNTKQPPFLSSSSSSLSLSELLGALSEQTEQSWSEDVVRDGEVRTWLDALLPSGRFRKNFSWSSADRKKRNFSLGLAGMCCNQGCTKNDIGRLC